MKKTPVIEFLKDFGIDFRNVINYIKTDCKIDRGFEAQQVGLRVPSATTTGLLTYILKLLDELTTREETKIKSEILSFEISDEKFDTAGFGSQLYATTWSTSLSLLGLLSLSNIKFNEVEGPIKWLCRTQSKEGGWSFTGVEEDNIIYTYQCVLALAKYYKRFKDELAASNLTRAYNFAIEFEPESETEKIIKTWLLVYLEEIINIKKPAKLKAGQIIDFVKIIKEEFANYIVFEHSAYPFSMQYFTPASYMFTRKFLSPVHPFNLYLIKYLMDNQVEGKFWSHITSKDSTKPFSFATALSILTLFYWGRDVLKNNLEKSEINFEKLEERIYQLGNQSIKLFISYSSHDKKIAQKIAKSLKNRGYRVWLDEWEIRVGDSIIDKIGKGIIGSDFLLILLSKKSVESKWVKQELNVAKMNEINKNKVFILPVLIEDCNIPSMISDKKYANLRVSYRRGISEILKVLQGV